MILTQLTGTSTERTLQKVAEVLAAAGLPEVMGNFSSTGFLTRYQSDPKSLQAIAEYFAPQPIQDLIDSTIAQIDVETDAIYGAVLGNRAEEYTLAATSAQAYKDAGYVGTVPKSVQSWAAAKGWTPKQSADDIITTANQWVAAQDAIRAQRLAAKERVRTATSAQEIKTAFATWLGFTSYIRKQLNVS